MTLDVDLPPSDASGGDGFPIVGEDSRDDDDVNRVQASLRPKPVGKINPSGGLVAHNEGLHLPGEEEGAEEIVQRLNDVLAAGEGLREEPAERVNALRIGSAGALSKRLHKSVGGDPDQNLSCALEGLAEEGPVALVDDVEGTSDGDGAPRRGRAAVGGGANGQTKMFPPMVSC